MMVVHSYKTSVLMRTDADTLTRNIWNQIQFLFWDLSSGQLTYLMIILSDNAKLYKPTTLKVHHPIRGKTALATIPGTRLAHSMIIFAPGFLIQINEGENKL
jgi:hypothetical protein